MVFHTVSAFTGKPQHFLTTFSPIKQEIKKINNNRQAATLSHHFLTNQTRNKEN